MHRFLLPTITALALCGCSTAGYKADFGELHSNPRNFFNLNPPVLAADASIEGKTLVLREGQALVVRLPEDAATGVWRMRALPRGTVIAPVEHDYTVVPGAEGAKATGQATFRLRGVAPGAQAVTLDYLPTGSATPQKSLAFDVTVK